MWHDKRISPRCLERGEQVLLYNSRLKLSPSKLKSQWSRPFKVVEDFPHGVVEVMDEQDGHQSKVNGHRLKHSLGVELSDC